MKNKVKICGVKFKVSERKVIDESQEGITQGMVKYSKAKIYLKKGLPKRLKKPVLYHEIVHGILMQSGYDKLSEDETFVQQMANALYETFKLR